MNWKCACIPLILCIPAFELRQGCGGDQVRLTPFQPIQMSPTSLLHPLSRKVCQDSALVISVNAGGEHTILPLSVNRNGCRGLLNGEVAAATCSRVASAAASNQAEALAAFEERFSSQAAEEQVCPIA